MKKSGLLVFIFITLSILLLSPVFAPAEEKRTNIIFVFDSSGSMDEFLNGKKKIEIAKDALSHQLDELTTEDNVGLLVFTDCNDIQLTLKVKPLKRDHKEHMKKEIKSFQPKRGTPIAVSLERAADSLKGLEGRKKIIMLTDGKESCGGNPEEAVKSIREKRGIDVVINVIAIGVSDEAKEQLTNIAIASGGKYYHVDRADQLDHFLEEAIKWHAKILFVRERNGHFESISSVKYDEPFYVEARFDSEPQGEQRAVLLEWGEGQSKEILLHKKTAKIFRSYVLYLKRPTPSEN